MQFNDIHEVPPSVERAVVINVATEVISSVAIASALRYAGMPLLVVNCTGHGVSKVLMDNLAQQWGFDIVDLELKPHGTTLDRLFRSIHADRILILDSDAEMRSPMTAARMRQAFGDPTVYGAGWIHHSQWLSADEIGMTINDEAIPTIYRERPWIPCAMFRTSFVRAGLDAGISFNESFASGAMVRNLNLDPHVLGGRWPMVVQNDTGADIHAWAKDMGLRFDGPDVNTVGDEVLHHHGVTRLAIEPESVNGTPITAIEQGALVRLRDAYPEYWNSFAAAVQTAQAAV